MSVVQYVQALSVKRDHIPKVSQVNDGFGIEAAIKMKAALEIEKTLECKNPYQIVFERHQKKLEHYKKYYQNNQPEIAKRSRENYQANPAFRERKRITARSWQRKNKDKVRTAQNKWIAKNRDKRNAMLKRYFDKMRARLTPDELKTYYKEKNKRAIASNIARLGYEGYRAQENARHRQWYKTISAEKLELKRAQSRERQRLLREKAKETPELLAAYRAKQAENQRKIRAKRKLQQEKQA